MASGPGPVNDYEVTIADGTRALKCKPSAGDMIIKKPED